MTDGSRSSTLSMSERSRGTGTLSRRWKAFLTRIRSVGRASKHSKQQEEEEEKQGTQEESKPRLSTESVIKPLPTFTDTPKRTAHYVSMPAGPVASALSPPPRHTMTKHTSSILERSVAIEQQKGDRPTQMRLRLSLDVEQHRQSSILCTSPSSDSSSSFKRYDDDDNINTVEGRRPSLPFRSGTLGTVKSDRLHTDMPPLPLPNPALLTSSASVSSNETLRERRRRRSPLSLPGEEQLTISLRSSLSVDDDTSLDISRQRAMHALEGKVVKMEPNPSPSHLSADALARDKAEYDAVVARTILRRTPHDLTPPPSSSSTVHHHNQPTLKAPELPSSPNSVFTATVVE